MALLDLQGMETERNGGGGGSHVSLALCASEASVTVCL
jgi:hypothetical protein